MAVGQAASTMAADAAALHALGDELQVLEADRAAVHARQLRTLLRMHAVDRAAGLSITTVANAALLLGASEARAGKLLTEALLLGELAGGLEAVECGLLTVEQSSVVVQQLSPLPVGLRAQVWARLQATLIGTASCSALPSARLTSLLRRWVIEADAEATEQRRRQEEAERRVDYRRRADGLHDLFAFGFTGPDLQAVAARIRARSAPVGPDDDRTADQRRFDAFKDLLLGRDPLPVQDLTDPLEQPVPAREGLHCPADCPSASPAGGGRARCGCWPGSPVPCGSELMVHSTVGAALRITDEAAELVGHGPIEPDLLDQLLLAAPRIRIVWTDDDGVPIAVGDQVRIPQRGDPVSVRRALLDLLGRPPDTLYPRHPHDHPPGTAAPPEPPETPEPPPASHDGAATGDALPTDELPGAHPPGRPGPYRVPRRLRRLLDVRSPRCEWPGCGARTVRCDAEHDLAWPTGPTCACNLGPCCRRHHRLKQQGWTKTRHSGSSVTWTDTRSGRQWLSRPQHRPPAPHVRPLPPVPVPDPLDELSPEEQEWELFFAGRLPDDRDPAASTPRATDPLSEDAAQPDDVLGEHLSDGDTRWTLDLDDPYAWNAAGAFDH